MPALPPHGSRRAKLPHRALQEYSLPHDNHLRLPFAIARSEVGTGCPALHVRSVFPVQASYPCQPLPHVIGATVSEYYEMIRLPKVVGSPTCRFGSAYLSHRWRVSRHASDQEPFGSPKFLTFLSRHATLFVDPGRPSECSPLRTLRVGFWHVKTIAVCMGRLSPPIR